MKQIKNPEYTKWARELHKYCILIGYIREIPVNDRCTHISSFPINYLTGPYCDNEQVKQWIVEHPAPAKMIDDPEFVALQERINVLEKENSDLKQGIGINMHEFLFNWHKNHDALDLEDVQFIIDKLLFHMHCSDTLNTMWSLAEEDEHLYTDKGLEAPFNFMGSDDDYHMTMLSVYIDRFIVSRNKTREQRYYECLQKDIDEKLKEKEGNNERN